ncbi:MAG TPA: hypothetical protein VMZ28_22370 [Kofleriaceae bacterium]|nr:hypothetical protein [Kofleriaceae bacterium]
MGRSWMMALLAATSACGFDSSGAGSSAAGAADGNPALDALADEPGEPVSVRIEALIDGRSQLRLSGATVQWLHLAFSAPGRHDGQHLPTLVDGIAWFPTWPDVPTDENRDCGCLSDAGALIDPPLPHVPSVATLTQVQVRGRAAVIEQPSAGNDFTTVVELDDADETGSDTYVVEIEVAPAREPPASTEPTTERITK